MSDCPSQLTSRTQAASDVGPSRSPGRVTRRTHAARVGSLREYLMSEVG